MPNATRVVQNEVDQSFSVGEIPAGIIAFMGLFKRGPVNQPMLISSWPQFEKMFGGFVEGNDAPLLAKRAFDRGTTLRVIGIKHYSDITAGTLAATKATKGTSSRVTTAADLAAGHTITVTIGGTALAGVLFSVSHTNTLKLVAALAKQLSTVRDAYVVNGALVIIPKTAAVVTGVTSGAGSPAVTITTVSTFSSSTPTELFDLIPKYPGADYNDLVVYIAPGSNGNYAGGYFDLIVDFPSAGVSEPVRNIRIEGNPTAGQSKYLDEFIRTSTLFDVVYKDLSGTAGQQTPVLGAIKYISGADGGNVVDADYIGSPASKTGLNAMDSFDDAMDFMIPNVTSNTVNQALIAYCDARKDLHAIPYLGMYSTEAAMAAASDALLSDSSYYSPIGGSLTIVDEVTGLDREISPMGDIAGVVGYSSETFGEWKSYAGVRRGKIFNAKGVKYNFGTKGNYDNMNLLANHRVNVVVVSNGLILLKGNFTGQFANSTLSFTNVRRMLIGLKKRIGPVFERYIEEPNNIPTWKSLYLEVDPELDRLKGLGAFYDYSYQGDQFATTEDKLSVNIPEQVSQGKYRVRLGIKPTVAIQEIFVDIIITKSGVSFEEVLNQVTN